MDGSVTSVRVMLRLKQDATARDANKCREHSCSHCRTWWTSILIPTMNSLAAETRSQRYNITATTTATGILLSYICIYRKDLHLQWVPRNIPAVVHTNHKGIGVAGAPGDEAKAARVK